MKKILLIDDEASLALVLRKVFPRFEIRQETCGADGLAAAYMWRPDLLLLDMNLPDISGRDIAKHVQRDPLLRRTPIVFLTGTLAFLETAQQPIEIEGCPAFGKPFNVAIFRWYVEMELQKQEAEGSEDELLRR